MEYVLQTNGLTKRFGKNTAVSGVDLSVKKGDIYGFIGKNGAGKTTLIRMVSGLASPTEGNIRLFESEELDQHRRKMGTMIENPAVFPNMTAKQNLHHYCLILGLDPKTNVEPMLELVGLQGTEKKKAKNFSLGMKQRLAIAVALLDNPELLLLDEPINGLDPTGIREIRELILKLNKEKNITILISSHILGELSKIANRYGIINNGKMVDEFTHEELQSRCIAELELKVDHVENAVQILTQVVGVQDYKVIDDKTIRVLNDLDKAGQINMELAKNGVVVNSSSLIGQDLESYFLHLMDHVQTKNS